MFKVVEREFKKYSMEKSIKFHQKNNTLIVFVRALIVLAYFSFNLVHAAMPVPAPPNVSAKNYFVIDFASGKVLAEKNPDKQIEPASITKIMTSYVVYKEIEENRLAMDDMVDISEKAWRMGI